MGIRARVERWLPVPNYEGLYEVSNFGRVKSLPRHWVRTERILRGRPGPYGHTQVTLARSRVNTMVLVHRLVLKTFKGDPPDGKPNCLHKDGDATNNRLWNLYWGDQVDNLRDCIRHGTHRAHEKKLLSIDQENLARRLWAQRVSKQEIARRLGVGNYILTKVLQAEDGPVRHSRFTPDMIEHMKHMRYRDDRTCAAIAVEYGTDGGTVSRLTRSRYLGRHSAQEG